MIIAKLENEGLFGGVTFENNSYIVRVYRVSEIRKAQAEGSFSVPIYTMSFGNGVQAEDRLLELLEHPAWTLLKHG